MPITIEFTVKNGDQSFKEDSVTFATAEELFEYISPGGGCESMPSDLGEIRMIFLPPEHPNITNPVADKRATLQLGIILITAPLATLTFEFQINEYIRWSGRLERFSQSG
jgi:hypothetical protein